MGQNFSNLTEHSTLFPVKLRETLPGLVLSALEEIQTGVSYLCNLLSSTDSWSKLPQNFAEEYTWGNWWDLELHRIIVNFKMDLSSSSKPSFQLVTRVMTGVSCSQSWTHIPQPARGCSTQKHPPMLYVSRSPLAVGLGMPKGIQLDDTAHKTGHHLLLPSHCADSLTMIKWRLLRKHTNLTARLHSLINKDTNVASQFDTSRHFSLNK